MGVRPTKSVTLSYTRGGFEIVAATKVSPLKTGTNPRVILKVVKNSPAKVLGGVPQLFLDAQELVVLGDTVRAGSGTGFNLPSVSGHGDIGDGRVLGLARTMGNNGRVTCLLGHLDGF